jgi:fluoride ion exporter CrcB/FEX
MHDYGIAFLNILLHVGGGIAMVWLGSHLSKSF